MRPNSNKRILALIMKPWSSWSIGVLLLLAFFGIVDSAYLTQHELNGTPLICNVQNLTGCNTVANSPYSHVFGVPLAEYGIFFYAVLFTIIALEFIFLDRILRRFIQGLAILGFVASAYFTFVQIFYIGAICVYCEVSSGIALLILLASFFTEPMRSFTRPSLPTS